MIGAISTFRQFNILMAVRSTRPTEINWTEYKSDLVIGDHEDFTIPYPLFQKTKQDRNDQDS